jgi:hypothetical protein
MVIPSRLAAFAGGSVAEGLFFTRATSNPEESGLPLSSLRLDSPEGE